jgi:hypothetical protein
MGQDILLFGTAMPRDAALVTERDEKLLGREFVRPVAGTPPELITTTDPAAANHSGSDGYFIFSESGPNAGTLYWDATGGSGADAKAIVSLPGVTSLHTSDFHVVV